MSTSKREREPAPDDMTMRIVVRTPYELLLDTRAVALVGEDHAGTFIVDRSTTPLLTALVPSVVRLHHASGEVTFVDVSWGSVTAVGDEARVIVRDAQIRGVPRELYEQAV